MVFSSSVFLFIFLPVTLLLYFMPLSIRNKKRETKKRNFILLLASLVFYAWGEPVYIILMLISIFFNYNAGIDIDESRRQGRDFNKRLTFVFALIFNLFVLGFFKYQGFITENLNSIFGLSITERELPLPVGISFYTFQILSYIIDVYKGKVASQGSIISFACYITMFPQLIAGPIVQYSDIEAQLSERRVDRDKLFDGIIFFIRGLGKKVIFANTVGAVYTDILAEGISGQSSATAWIGIICYSLQIYFDFSGYSDMAVGLGKIMGFEFVNNFNFPYSAVSITDFWRRWHISLSSWFRDYVYIPLGGNRKGSVRTIINILTVWSLTGMWHGASWNFIAWGAFYGILLISEKYIFAKILPSIPTLCRRVLTMIIVMVGWVFFSNTDISLALEYLGVMFGTAGNLTFDGTSAYLLSSHGFAIIIMGLSATGVFSRLISFKSESREKVLKIAGYSGVFILSVAFLISETYNPFLYFRF